MLKIQMKQQILNQTTNSFPPKPVLVIETGFFYNIYKNRT